MYLSGRILLGGALDQKGVLFILGVWGLVFFVGLSSVVFFEMEGFFSSFPTFPFVQELQTSLISKKFSVSRDARAPWMKNAGNCLARILDKTSSCMFILKIHMFPDSSGCNLFTNG